MTTKAPKSYHYYTQQAWSQLGIWGRLKARVHNRCVVLANRKAEGK